MFLSKLSTRRPVAILCLIIAFLFLGINSYKKIPLEFLPKVDLPYVTVQAIYPGATPEEIESEVAKHLEDALSSTDGLKNMTTQCMENVCIILLEFNLDKKVDVAANDVREKIDSAKNNIPSEVENIKVLKFDINAAPIISMTLEGENKLEDIYEYADNNIKDNLASVPGVASVNISGSSDKEIQILLDRNKLSDHNISSIEIEEILKKSLSIIPSGKISSNIMEYNIKFDGEAESLSSIENMIIQSNNGLNLKVKDIAKVVISTEEARTGSYINGEKAITIKVIKRSDANDVEVVNKIKDKIKEINVPESMKLSWISDTGGFTKASVDSAKDSIWQGILLTAFILFMFLYNIRSTFVIAISMPITIIISLFFINMFGYSLNTSTLLALGLSVGILVTNSIVVIENIIDKINKGKSAKEASEIGTSEVAMAVFASATTNIVVLFPIAMMQSRVGLFFKPFAMTMVLITAVSLFISFTLTPLLAAKFLKDNKKFPIEIKLENWWNNLFTKFEKSYRNFIKKIVSHKILSLSVIAISIVTLIFSLFLGQKVGFSFVPESDRGEISVKYEFPTYYNIETTTERILNAEDLLKDLPELKSMLSNIGKVQGNIGQASEGVYLGETSLKFSDKTDRKIHIDELKAMVRDRLKDLTDCIVSISVASSAGGQGKRIELEIHGTDLNKLNEIAEAIEIKSMNIPGFKDQETTVRKGKPLISFIPNIFALRDLKIPPAMIGKLLRTNFEGEKVGELKQGSNNYDIKIKFDSEKGISQIKSLYFPINKENPLFIDTFAERKEGLSSTTILRSKKIRTTKFLSNLDSSLPLGSAVNKIEEEISKSNLIPPGYSYKFSGIFEVMKEGIMEMLEAAIIAGILTYLLLASLMESFKTPFIILTTIPFSLIGVTSSLFIANESLSIFALLGIVMLIGIVVNNAILIMEKYNILKNKITSKSDAIIEACTEELRPICMITLAAALGMLPMAIGTDLGSEIRQGIGISSLGGILSSALLTLIVLPVIYSLFTKEK